MFTQAIVTVGTSGYTHQDRSSIQSLIEITIQARTCFTQGARVHQTLPSANRRVEVAHMMLKW
jgi:hypothetical protein